MTSANTLMLTLPELMLFGSLAVLAGIAIGWWIVSTFYVSNHTARMMVNKAFLDGQAVGFNQGRSHSSAAPFCNAED